MLADDISKMSEAQQKLLWMQIHIKELTALAKQMDASVTPHNILPEEIDLLINKAKKHARLKKKS